MYYTYMIRCKDNSIYTGITTNLEKRMQEHFTKDEKCAKYTKNILQLDQKELGNQKQKFCIKLEYWIKHLSKLQKENLIKILKTG